MHRAALPTKPFAHGLLNVACFSVALVVSACVVGRALPFPNVPAVGPKYRYLEANKDRFDTLFIGSSRIYHQIDPQQFDAEVAALGGHTRSYNLAYDAMWPPESFYFLHRILALRPPHLRWVFIELMQINLTLETGKDETLRTAYWHDWRHTRLAGRDIVASPRQSAEKWRALAEQASTFLRWNANFGRGAEILSLRLLPRKPERPPRWLGRAGFLPETNEGIPPAELPVYLEKVAGLRLTLTPNPVTPHYFEALQELIAAVRQAGAQPIFVITPSLGGEHFTGLPAGVPLLAYDDPTKYPTLYEPDRHHDQWHLNERGAAELTSLLARHFAEIMHRP